MSLNQSFSMPNLPGMVPDRRSWAYREQGGFKRSAPLSARPGTSQGSRPASPSPFVERSDIFNTINLGDQKLRPSTAGGLPSMRPVPFGGFVQTPSMADLPRPSTAAPALAHSQSQTVRPSTGKLPRYVETDKQIARFYGHFVEVRPWDREGPLGESTIEPQIHRSVVIHYYIYDDTLEINEPKTANSGMVQGSFFRRNRAQNDTSGAPVTLLDLIPGNQIRMLGQTFAITDADNFTRDYFKKELNVILPPAMKKPPAMVADMAGQYATGLGASSASLLQLNKSFNTRSTDYLTTKETFDKTNMFLRYDGQVLRFLCVEVEQPFPPFFPRLEQKLAADGHDVRALAGSHGFVASANAKRFAFSYYLATAQMDLITQRRKGERDAGMDEPKTVLKKTQMPKNWRDVQSRGRAPIFYDVADFRLGRVLDIYGRYFLLVNCDSFTSRSYQQMGVAQRDVTLVVEEEEKVVQPVPEAGDGFLPIGSAEDTLATVYGMPKPTKNVQKIYRNQGRSIRCRALLLAGNPVDASRRFFLTFYLEDDSLQVTEEAQRNSGVWTGTFLKRGRYLNELPSDADEPRYVLPHDIYLGNVISVNGYQFQITEMDNMSLKFCENYPDEFPMSDTFRVLGLMMLKIVEMQVDLRVVLAGGDRKRQGFVDQETFLRSLDALMLCDDLNDQEVLTVMRRFADAGGQVYHQEMCDLISHVYFQHQSTTLSLVGGSPKNKAVLTTFDAFAKAARARTIQWRRTLRKEQHTISGKCTVAVLAEVFGKNGMDLADSVVEEITRRYRVPDEDADPILQELHRRHASESAYHGLDGKVQPKLDRKQSTVRKKLLTSTSIAAKLTELRRKASTNSSLFRRSSTNDSSFADDVRSAQRANILVNYDKMCDDIYICDWLY